MLATTGFVVVIAAHAPALIYGRYANVDEAYASALGERLLEGFRLYQGAISQRGPLMYYLYELFDAAFGWDNVRGVRLMAVLFALAHLSLVWVTGRKLISEGVAGLATLICAYAITLGFYPWDGIPLNGEVLQIPFVLGGVLLGGLAMRTPPESAKRTLRVVAAGLLFGLAITIKQTAIAMPLPLLAWLTVSAVRRSDGKRHLADAFACVLAVAFPASVILLRAALDGTLTSLWYYCVTYNLVVHGTGDGRFADWYRALYDHLRINTAYFLLVAIALARAGRRWTRRVVLALRSRRARVLVLGFGAEDYVALSAFAALVMAASLPQHFGHYYVLPAPLLALSAAATARPLLRPFRVEPALRTILTAAGTLLITTTAIFVYETADGGGLLTHDKFVLTTAAYIERTTSPRDKVFVWGFSPWLSGYSNRRPAGRYVFETYVTGFVPLRWDDLPREASRVVPGSLEALLGDLDRERPAIVADAGSTLIARPMLAYAAAARWLRAGYCFETRIGTVDIYRRLEVGASCDSPYFPCPHPARNHFGAPLFVPVPPIVDRAGSRLLGPGPVDQPKGFMHDEEALACP